MAIFDRNVIELLPFYYFVKESAQRNHGNEMKKLHFVMWNFQ